MVVLSSPAAAVGTRQSSVQREDPEVASTAAPPVCDHPWQHCLGPCPPPFPSRPAFSDLSWQLHRRASGTEPAPSSWHDCLISSARAWVVRPVSSGLPWEHRLSARPSVTLLGRQSAPSECRSAPTVHQAPSVWGLFQSTPVAANARLSERLLRSSRRSSRIQADWPMQRAPHRRGAPGGHAALGL